MSGRKAVLGLFVTILCIFSSATTGAEDTSPYGAYKKDPAESSYGENRPVTSIEEARRVLKEYFAKKDVRIGEIREQKFFFESEIRDKNNNLIDKVIIDKRTGRIRSTY
jgi:hypothetical protein